MAGTPRVQPLDGGKAFCLSSVPEPSASMSFGEKFAQFTSGCAHNGHQMHAQQQTVSVLQVLQCFLRPHSDSLLQWLTRLPTAIAMQGAPP